MPKDCSLVNLLKNCLKFLFYYYDFGPGNIIMNTVDSSLEIIDWEIAGFSPNGWIRTKFCVSGGMDVPGDDHVPRVVIWTSAATMEF